MPTLMFCQEYAVVMRLQV